MKHIADRTKDIENARPGISDSFQPVIRHMLVAVRKTLMRSPTQSESWATDPFFDPLHTYHGSHSRICEAAYFRPF